VGKRCGHLPLFTLDAFDWGQSRSAKQKTTHYAKARNARSVNSVGYRNVVMKGEDMWTTLFSVSLAFAIAFSVAAVVMQNDDRIHKPTCAV
jgi:hypothetical protein